MGKILVFKDKHLGKEMQRHHNYGNQNRGKFYEGKKDLWLITAMWRASGMAAKALLQWLTFQQFIMLCITIHVIAL